MLYYGRYLIVLVDDYGEIRYVFDNAKEYAGWQGISVCQAFRRLRRVKKGEQNTGIILIDCVEEHDDVFAEEDAEFLKFASEEGLHKTNKQRALEMGLSERTFYRRGFNKRLEVNEK